MMTRYADGAKSNPSSIKEFLNDYFRNLAVLVQTIRWRELKFTLIVSSWCDIYVPSTRGQINEETKDSWLTMLMEQKVNN